MHELRARATGASLQSDRRVLLEQFALVDVARKVVGVGSVGTRAWIALMLGRDGQRSAVPAGQGGPGLGAGGLRRASSDYANHGERVVAGQHLMQATSDIFLGWTAR